MLLTLITILGLVFGSFLTAYTYRAEHELSITKGRSKCPKCRVKISWYDNIPLVSYLALGGKCRHCGKKISARYPAIEALTTLSFTLIYFFVFNCATGRGTSLQGSVICAMYESWGWLALPYLLFVALTVLAVFVTDWEKKIIPDAPVFLMFAVSVVIAILYNPSALYTALLLSFATALFFLALNLITRGRGMGLGDVKLVMPLALILGDTRLVITWLLISFVLGAAVGLVLIALGKAKFGKHIAFGPFLIVGFFVILLFGGDLVNVLFPYL